MRRLALVLVLLVACIASPPGRQVSEPVVRASVAAPLLREIPAPRASRSRQTIVPRPRIATRHARQLPATAGIHSRVPSLLIAIRSCESGGGSGRADDVDWHQQNGSSSASGGYQVIDGTWDGYGGYQHAKDAPAAVQDAFARRLFAALGSRPWNASRRCWSRLL